MRRTDTRPPSGVRSQTPPGREGNGGEGCESFSANSHHDGAGVASSNAVAEFANVLWQALQMANEEGQPPLQICSGEPPTGWSASGDMVRRLRRRGTPWSQPAWVGATGEGRKMVIGEMPSATAGEANRTPCRSPTARNTACLLYTSPSPRDKRQSRMPSSA